MVKYYFFLNILCLMKWIKYDILDISGSMGTYVNQILTKVIPKVYEKL